MIFFIYKIVFGFYGFCRLTVFHTMNLKSVSSVYFLSHPCFAASWIFLNPSMSRLSSNGSRFFAGLKFRFINASHCCLVLKSGSMVSAQLPMIRMYFCLLLLHQSTNSFKVMDISIFSGVGGIVFCIVSFVGMTFCSVCFAKFGL